MRKECKKLLKQNNEREKKINKTNDEVYTNMIVYMRGSEIDEYNQEKVRADLIEMIIDGQERGEDIKHVMGGNYKEICDEIIETFPKKSKKQKIMDIVDISLTSIWILIGISVIQSVIIAFAKGDKSYSYGLTIGNLLNMVIITGVASVMVTYQCKNTFTASNKNKVFEFLKDWIGIMVIIGTCVALSYFLDYVVIETSIIYAAIFGAIVFCFERIVGSRI